MSLSDPRLPWHVVQETLKPNGKHGWNAAGFTSESTGREGQSQWKKRSAVAEIQEEREVSVAADMGELSRLHWLALFIQVCVLCCTQSLQWVCPSWSFYGTPCSHKHHRFHLGQACSDRQPWWLNTMWNTTLSICGQASPSKSKISTILVTWRRV